MTKYVGLKSWRSWDGALTGRDGESSGVWPEGVGLVGFGTGGVWGADSVHSLSGGAADFVCALVRIGLFPAGWSFCLVDLQIAWMRRAVFR